MGWVRMGCGVKSGLGCWSGRIGAWVWGVSWGWEWDRMVVLWFSEFEVAKTGRVMQMVEGGAGADRDAILWEVGKKGEWEWKLRLGRWLKGGTIEGRVDSALDDTPSIPKNYSIMLSYVRASEEFRGNVWDLCSSILIYCGCNVF